MMATLEPRFPTAKGDEAPDDGCPPERVREALRRFDAANAQDPTLEPADGTVLPAALLYAQRMSATLEAFAPNAPQPVCLAARAQHLERWKIPRSTYPEGKKGYHQWRSDLARYHADRAGEVLRDVGFDAAVVSRVQALLRKERLKQDPDVQLLEDVACLVFLEHYFADFAQQHDDEKVIDILRKTWRKMSPTGQQAALRLRLSATALDLIVRALDPQA